MQGLFEILCDKHNVEPDADGECWIECPFCGKGDHHFSFSERGFHCFVCGESGGLVRLNGGLVPYTVRPPRRRKPKPKRGPLYWQTHANHVLGQLRSKPNTVLAEQWSQYRPFTVDSVEKYQLGYGLLPASKCKHTRLIYPAYDGTGDIKAFRGRSIHCNCDKWLQSAGSKAVLWGREFLYENAVVIVCESPVDAMLAMQIENVCAVASTGGAGVWRDEWTSQIAAYNPVRIIVWFDNDLAGQPNAETWRRLAQEWKQEHPNLKRLPRANGPYVANRLIRAGLPALLYRWAMDAPPKADLSWALMEAR